MRVTPIEAVLACDSCHANQDQHFGLFGRAGVHRQAAAAVLPLGDERLHPVLGQHPQGGPVDLRGQHLLGALGGFVVLVYLVALVKMGFFQ